MTRLLLISNSTQHGTGYLEYCAPRIADFLAASAARTVMFVPFALRDHDAYTKTAREAYRRIGHEVRSAHEVDDPCALLAECDAVFVGGGNTFRLLDALYRTGLIESIRARVAAGMPYLGSSAGTNVACVSIRTTNDMPIVQPPSFDALGLVPFNINPHYLDPDPNSKHMGETRETRVREFHEENEPPVVGLREGAILQREGDRLTLIGATGARLFRRDMAPTEYRDGADLSELLLG